MAGMETTQSISAGATKSAPQYTHDLKSIRPERLLALRALPYEAYLTTSEWRQRRDRALRIASWRCQSPNCSSKRQLQVHHRSYDRIGIELDQDLEVLCDRCHRRKHTKALEASELGIYLKLVREAQRLNQFWTIADLTEDTKRLCASNKIPYSGPEIHQAIGLITGAKTVRVTSAILNASPFVPASAALSAQAAHEVLSALNIGGVQAMAVVKTMPDGFLPYNGNVLEQIQLLRAQQSRLVQRPASWLERLEEIFAPEPPDDEVENISSEQAEIAEWIRTHPIES